MIAYSKFIGQNLQSFVCNNQNVHICGTQFLIHRVQNTVLANMFGPYPAETIVYESYELRSMRTHTPYMIPNSSYAVLKSKPAPLLLIRKRTYAFTNNEHLTQIINYKTITRA